MAERLPLYRLARTMGHESLGTTRRYRHGTPRDLQRAVAARRRTAPASGGPMSFFAHQTAAERYAHARPYFHPLVMRLLRERLGLALPIPRALDVACGTGQSTRALRELATTVVGVDPSVAMLTAAPPPAPIRLIAAVAESLPFAPAAFDLLTVALGFHWFDRARFLAEAYRVLRPNGWLVIYNNGFSGRMQENPAFEHWSQGRYLARYPSPGRGGSGPTEAEAAAAGFRIARSDFVTNEVTFTPAGLVDYLMTQSNVIAALEEGADPASAIQRWFVEEVTPLFPAERGTFLFGGPVWYLKRQPESA